MRTEPGSASLRPMRMRVSAILAVGVLVSACARSSGGFAAPPASTPVTTPASHASLSPAPGPSRTAAPCRVDHVRASVENGVAATGTYSLLLAFRNGGPLSCSLTGYPGISLLDSAGHVLPFRVTHAGNQVVTSAHPNPVTLQPGAEAYAAFGKYRCDGGDKAMAVGARVLLPGQPRSSSFTVRLILEPRVGFCGPGDPGSTLAVSPIFQSRAETGRTRL